ncbi:MAG: hypothetical protein Q8R63_04365 [Ramlibacter sp.]|nr:hypothetical protein [Ramlibacter sp.]
MNKHIISSLIAATLAVGGTAFAQGAEGQAGSAYNNNQVDYGPVPGTPEYYGNSGFTPPPTTYWDGRRRYAQPRAVERYVPAYPYRNEYRGTARDRDGDGVVNRRDRWPNDPSRS